MSTDGLEGHGNFRDDFARYGASKEFNGSWDVQSFNGASRVSSGEMSHQIVMVKKESLWGPLRHLFSMWRLKSPLTGPKPAARRLFHPPDEAKLSQGNGKQTKLKHTANID
ncbi:unnamed protein product [Calypogeia fissa]